MWKWRSCGQIAFILVIVAAILYQVIIAGILYHNSLSVWRQVAPHQSVVHSGISATVAPQADNTTSDPTSVEPVLPSVGADLPGDDDGRVFQHQTISLNDGRAVSNLTYKASVAIGLGITTRARHGKNMVNSEVMKLSFFRTLLPSFCHTASPGYDYQFYLAYDYNDHNLRQFDLIKNITLAFSTFTKAHCPAKSSYSIHFVQCSHTGKPAWAQNDAMIQAYLAGVDYMYRINDDTKMETAGWTERFIQALEGFSPPRVGVVGPKHKGGNTAILTYDFTHRTHVEILGFYYPREFQDWFGDKWVTEVYKPGRSLKLPGIQLLHTMENGQRYKRSPDSRKKLDSVITRDRTTIIRYAIAAEAGFLKPSGKLVIAMPLVSTDAAHVWGVVRNAQLAPVIYRGWKLQIYTSHSLIDTSQVGSGDGRPLNASKALIPPTVVRTLERLGAGLVYVDAEVEKSVPGSLWHYLAADQPHVDAFVIRDATGRLSERDRATVQHWINAKNSKAVQCIKDHPNQANLTMVDGMWGAKTNPLLSITKHTPIRTLLKEYASSIEENATDNIAAKFLRTVLYPKLRGSIVYYDSVNCDRADSLPFPVERTRPYYIGQQFDAHEQPILNEKKIILSSTNPNCQPSL